MMTATASAQDTIQEGSIFFGADLTNTVDLATGGAPVGWTVANNSIDGLTGFNHSLTPDVAVTTITGLIPNYVYDVAAVYTNLSFFNTNFSAGTDPGALVQAPVDTSSVTPLTGFDVGTGDAYDLAIGTAITNEAGELQVFVDDGTENNQASFFFSYAGITALAVGPAATAIPEPSSLACLLYTSPSPRD